MRKAYGDTRHGQIHLRDSHGPGRPLMLLHMTPLSGAMFLPAAPAFEGLRLLLPDLVGYGRSDPRGEPWRMADWADSLADLLDWLGVAEAAVYGAHVGAAVALELALRHPARVSRLMLDGLPFLTAELRAAFAAIAAAPRPAALGEVVPRVEAMLGEFGGGDPFRAMIDYLETGFVSSAPVSAVHDPAPALGAVEAPLLLLGAAGDSQAASLATARALRPEAPHHLWPGRHPVHDPARAAEFAAPIRAFAG
jgi:pimeloyl-ACP methyl ester carboxylesterase